MTTNTAIAERNDIRQDYRIGTARKMSVDVDATPDLLLLIQQKLRIVHYRYGSLFPDILMRRIYK